MNADTVTCADARAVTGKKVNQIAKRFTLQKANSANSIQAICTMTNGFKEINTNYTAAMLETIKKRKYTWSCSLAAPLNDIVTKQIIGKNGLHLKTFTTKYGVDLIWHNRPNNSFELWGPKSELINALFALTRQIARFVKKHEEELNLINQLDNTMNMVRLREDTDDDEAFLAKKKRIKYE